MEETVSNLHLCHLNLTKHTNAIFFSEKDFLREKLEEYVAQLSVPVHIIRHAKREGLIRARLNGAEKAKGEGIKGLRLSGF